ncbi:MAG: outer membrane protein assembly factor BamD [Bacteroidota bacterium]|jgi:outer membrane protein assembly factor BamD|nr:outer membrane protein assembly factor BamD [Chitinophagaceae bacterium]MCE2758541.1 outer membrane protein assembly factor BamD [Chitinophagaceae bacterium]
MRNCILLILSLLFFASCSIFKKGEKRKKPEVELNEKSRFSKVLKSKDYEFKLKMANLYYDKKDFRKAQVLYEEVFPVFKGTPQHEDLYYKYANAHFNLKDYITAENLLKGYLEVFPNSPRAEEVEYLNAYCYYKQSPKAELEQANTIKAIGMMQIYLNNHPNSKKKAEAEDIINKLQQKLELKESLSAQLYFNVGQFRAAALAFTTLMNNYPDSEKSDAYKLMAIKAYYRYANMSVDQKLVERYTKVITEVEDFQDRFPESNLLKEAERYLTLSKNNLKNINNEQTPQTAGK